MSGTAFEGRWRKSVEVPAKSRILRVDPWAGSLALVSAALALATAYMGMRTVMVALGIGVGVRSVSQLVAVLLLPAFGLVVTGSLCLLRLRSIGHLFRHGVRTEGTIVELVRHRDIPVAARYNFTVRDERVEAEARIPNPHLIKPNPLAGLAAGDRVRVVHDAGVPARALLAELYLGPLGGRE